MSNCDVKGQSALPHRSFCVDEIKLCLKYYLCKNLIHSNCGVKGQSALPYRPFFVDDIKLCLRYYLCKN